MTTQPFIPAANTIQLTALYGLEGEVACNVLHFRISGTPTVTSLNNLIDYYASWESTTGKGMRGTSTALQRCIARDMSTQDSIVVDRQIIPQVVGVVGGTQLPNNVTLAVALRTGLAGRSFRGRIFHLGLTTAQQNGSFVADSAKLDIVSKYTTLKDGGVSAGFTLAVVSKRHNNAWRLGGAVVTPVASLTCDGNLDSMRRRLPGHNVHH